MKTARKYLAHYIDSNFDLTYEETDYIRLGKDLESFSETLNPDTETKQNIIGETSTIHNGYEAEATVDTYYHDHDGKLEGKLMDFAMNRTTGEECKTSYTSVLMKPGATDESKPVVVKAWREDVYVIPTEVGGDTSGVQIPFDIKFDGNRVEGNFDLDTKIFTPKG